VRKRIVVEVALTVLVALALTACASLEEGAHDPAFFELVQTGTLQEIQDAVSSGADVNDRSNLGYTPLMAAAMNSRLPEVVTALLGAGADVNARDRYDKTPLIYAAKATSNPAVIATLLNAGADINARDSAGWTALMYATAFNSGGGVTITTLLKAGADARVRDSLGHSAWDLAAANHLLNGNPVVLQLEESSR